MVKRGGANVADAVRLSNDSDESQDEVGLIRDDLENAEELVFDFEAYPICDDDKEGLVNMLTQIFLRVDIDVKQMADILVEQSPFGCVYRPSEEFMDEDDEGIVYGVLSMLKLGTDQKFQTDIWALLKARAQKYSVDKKISSILENLSTPKSDIRVGLLINERLLHFPATIASPAFKSLANDLKKFAAQYRFSHVVLILKIRIADKDSNKERNEANASDVPNKRKKLTKAQKKRIAASAIANAKVIYDNREEELLFQGGLQFDYFQYPVQSDVEKDSKFGSVVREGITYRPYRRVCFLDSSTFHRYIELVSSADKL
ncbi:p21-C-terminal region-binding family protein [Brugia pahangi]